jgi:hypothetical protein
MTGPMLGFKSFDAVQWTLAGIERMHMLRSGKANWERGTALYPGRLITKSTGLDTYTQHLRQSPLQDVD